MSLHLTGLLDVLRQEKPYRQLLDALADGSGSAPANVVRSARPYLAAALARDWTGPIIYLTAAVRRAYNVSEQLPLWLDDPARVHRFAEPSALFYDRAAWDASVIRNRMATLAALQYSGETVAPIIVTSARAIMQGTLPPSHFADAAFELAVGDRHQMEALILRWIGMGYEPATIVIESGSFSRRGGILDIYPLASDYPLRIEFFDDEIESLRRFDPGDQRSIERVDSARIVPAREVLPSMTPLVADALGKWVKSDHERRRRFFQHQRRYRVAFARQRLRLPRTLPALCHPAAGEPAGLRAGGCLDPDRRTAVPGRDGTGSRRERRDQPQRRHHGLSDFSRASGPLPTLGADESETRAPKARGAVQLYGDGGGAWLHAGGALRRAVAIDVKPGPAVS